MFNALATHISVYHRGRSNNLTSSITELTETITKSNDTFIKVTCDFHEDYP